MILMEEKRQKLNLSCHLRIFRANFRFPRRFEKSWGPLFSEPLLISFPKMLADLFHVLTDTFVPPKTKGINFLMLRKFEEIFRLKT